MLCASIKKKKLEKMVTDRSKKQGCSKQNVPAGQGSEVLGVGEGRGSEGNGGVVTTASKVHRASCSVTYFL